MAKKNETPVVETEEMKQKFQAKLVELLALGKKKKNMLEYQEISDFFKDMPLEADKMELVLDYLDHNGIDVLRISDDDDDDAFDAPITYYNDAVSDDQLPEEYNLGVNEERTGLLVFEVPEDSKDYSISYLEQFSNETEGDVFFVFFTAKDK